MDRHYGEEDEEVSVAGFEVPRSPISSYNNPVPGNEDEARDPPQVPPHLRLNTLFDSPVSGEASGSLPLPQNVVLNHLYIEKRDPPRSVVAVGMTHRFHSKYITVVLYKPIQRRLT